MLHKVYSFVRDLCLGEYLSPSLFLPCIYFFLLIVEFYLSQAVLLYVPQLKFKEDKKSWKHNKVSYSLKTAACWYQSYNAVI